MTLTKNSIVEDVVKLGFTYKRAQEISETLLEIMKMTLADGEDVLYKIIKRKSSQEISDNGIVRYTTERCPRNEMDQ